jgi:hypothetical protein
MKMYFVRASGDMKKYVSIWVNIFSRDNYNNELIVEILTPNVDFWLNDHKIHN